MYMRFLIVLLVGIFSIFSGHAQDKLSGAVYSPPTLAKARAAVIPQVLSAEQVRAVPSVELALPPSSMRQGVLNQLNISAPGVPMRIGTERDINQLDTVSKVQTFAPARVQADGTYRQFLKIRTPKAQSVRLALQFTDIDDRSQIRFFTGDGQTQVGHSFSGAEIIDLLGKNLASNDKSDNAVTWWSPTAVGDSIILVLDFPDLAAKTATKFAITRISHIELSEKDIALTPYTAGACNLDAVCYGAWSNTAASVAQIRFQSGGYSYLCTGTLMNNTANDRVPYFLTANHCINTQTVASTVESRWFLQSQICNDPTQQVDSRYATTTGGADLLYNSTSTDVSFIKLRGALPGGVYFAGWSAAAPALGRTIAGLHHPSGDLKKISFGAVNNYQNCTSSSGGYFTCTTASGTTGNFINVQYSQGTTEPGSSGSGLFITDATYGNLFVGNLFGGNSSCTNLSGSNIYGRFDTAYFAALKTWLWPADSRKTIAVTASGTGAGVVTSAPAGISCGSTCTAAFDLNTAVALTASPVSGSQFDGWSGACTGTSVCNLTMSVDKAVTANFTAIGTRLLTFSKTGSGTVTSSPSGVSCGAGCSGTTYVSFPAGTNVTLTAVPDAGYSFGGWGGACSGVGNCTVSMSVAQTVTATFQTVVTLGAGAPVSGLSGALSSQQFFQFTVPANANISTLNFMTTGGTGDADLYVKLGALPSTISYDCKSNTSTSTEACAISNPSPGSTYFVLIDGYSAFSGVTLSVGITGTATLTIVKKGSGAGAVVATTINNAQVLSIEAPSTQEEPRGILSKNASMTLAQDTAGAMVSRVATLKTLAQNNGNVPVIVGLRVPFAAEGNLKQETVLVQRQQIVDTQTRLLTQLKAVDGRLIELKTFDNIPFIALHATAMQLDAMVNSVDVISLDEDIAFELTLDKSEPLIGATQAWSAGYTGAGKTVAVLDTGVDKSHPFLTGKVVSEACYSTTTSSNTSLCPGGVSSSTATGSAAPCASGCEHGTHVAGISAGKGSTFSGVAKDANLIAIQVFSRTATGVSAQWSDILSGLQRVYALRNNYAISSVNISIGGGLFPANCDNSYVSFKAAIDNLRSVGTATIIAAGNDGASTSLSAPACISSAISVGSVHTTAGYDNTCKGWSILGSSSVDEISCFSNSASFLSILAPGSLINSSVPGGAYARMSGTSMAAPHVAGAWAVYKQKYPQASVPTVLGALQQTGAAITDPRNNITKPRINLINALSLTPADLINCGTKCTVTLNIGDQITLTAGPTGTNVFDGWTGLCTGKTSTCTITVGSDQTLTAAFDTLQISRAKKIIPILMLLLDN